MWKDKPLLLIMLTGIFFRLLAVIFSKGFGMHDDHFLIIEASQSWVDGYDYNSWLPAANSSAITPSGHSFFYTGLHYFLFRLLKFIGITDAQTKMYIVRFLHALLSLSIVYYGYRITEKISNTPTAKVVGLLLSIYWFMPFLSVRNLIEFVCIPPLIYATWLLIINRDTNKKGIYFLIGLILGIAFSIRFQTVLFTGGIFLALLIQKRFIPLILSILGFAACAVLIQGGTDYFVWGAPFVEFKEYIRYNIESANAYISQGWYTYFLTLGGILIPPVSLFLLFGFFRNWKKHLILFLPSFIFLVFHSYFPNKQERFIAPIIPFIIILGYAGWSEFQNSSEFWMKRKKLLHSCWVFFWILNTIPLFFISVTYSKKSRVESMTYIESKKDVKSLIMEESTRDDFLMPPRFYLEKWVPYYGVTSLNSVEKLYKDLHNLPVSAQPNYVVFINQENIEKRVDEFKKYYPALTYETTIESSFIDKVVHYLNPINKNQTFYVYKIGS